MATKEIITLQLGHYSNFVGTHWWNIQESSFNYGSSNSCEEREEIDHDVLFREGETSRGEITFTPRLVLTELKGGLGGLKATGVLYDDIGENENGMPSHHDLMWDEDIEMHTQPSEPKNQFLKDLDNGPMQGAAVTTNGDSHDYIKKYDLEHDVTVWSDYSRTFLHPKSILIVNEYSHASENDPFDLWMKGSNLKNVVEEIEERIRFYAEECDLMQGFHILMDAHNGFAGLASSAIQYLHDEFSSKQLVTFPMSPARFGKDSKIKTLKRDINRSLSLPVLLEHSSLVCPLSLSSGISNPLTPHLIYDSNLSYHTSAILASALDTMTLNHRLKANKGINLNNFCDNVTYPSKKLVTSSLAMPFPLLDTDNTASPGHSTLSKFLSDHLDCDPWTTITPDIGNAGSSILPVEMYSQSLTLRGIRNEKFVPKDVCDIFEQLSKHDEMLDYYLNTRFYGSENFSCCFNTPMKTTPPFPQFFSGNVTRSGYLRPTPPNNLAHDMWKSHVFANGDLKNGHTSISNGHIPENPHKEYENGITSKTPNGDKRLGSKCLVESIPIMTNLQCSSNAANMLKRAAVCLRQNRKRHFSFHSIENDNLETDIESLCVLQDEYRPQPFTNDSDSDGDL